MRLCKPVVLYLPDLLVKELHIYLSENPPKYKFEINYFYYVIHYLTIKQIEHKKREYFSLNNEVLKTVTISNIARYTKTLKNGEFIESDNSYEPGVKSLGYKINPMFLKGIHSLELTQDSKLSKNMIKRCYRRKSHVNRLEPYLKTMYDEFLNMEIDYENAIKWVENNVNDDKKLTLLTSINHIQDSRFRHFKRNKTNGRLDTNLTNLKSDLRQFIIGDYVSIDLKNSQPFLLGVLINNIINNRDTLCCYLSKKNLNKVFGIKGIKQVLLIHQNLKKNDLAKFRMFLKAVLNGCLYEDFINRYSDTIDRKDVKTLMFKVLFSKNECFKGYKKFVPYEDSKKIFASVYPFVYDTVKVLKHKNNRRLPIYLQQLESYLFIDCIAKKLAENGIVPFTIHDSIIIKTENLNNAISVMNEVFQKEVGETPSFDVKPLKRHKNDTKTTNYDI